jgi:hypothetical protein
VRLVLSEEGGRKEEPAQLLVLQLAPNAVLYMISGDPKQCSPLVFAVKAKREDKSP